jgi:enamine deaminase RidA (YjgF/YER057c/UK114 family)
MPKQALNPSELFDSRQYGFSQGVVSSGGKTVYLSGQVGWDEHQQVVGGDDLHQQARQALRNIEIALKAAGGALSDVVSLRIYIVQHKMSENRGIRLALQEFFPGDSPPASTWIGVPSLANEDFLVEFEAVAVIGAE